MIRTIFYTLFLITIISRPVISQNTKSFSGMLEYKITPVDTTLKDLIPENKMIVYSNDTIVRIENFTQHLGKQVTIRHMKLNKSYLLVDTPFGKYAIRADHNKADSVEQEPKFTFDNKCGRKKILGRKAKKALVSHESFEDPIEFLYLKGYSSEIIGAFENLNGLPVQYVIPTPDALMQYELVKISEYTPSRDLFGIPSEYEKIDFNDFMDKLIESKSELSPEGN